MHNILKSKSYKDGNNTALIKSGTNISITEGVNGDFIVATTQKTVAITVITDSSGNATINLIPYSFTSSPIVTATCVATSTSQPTVCNITSVSNTSLVIKTFVTQNIIVTILGLATSPVSAVSATVNLIIIGS